VTPIRSLLLMFQYNIDTYIGTYIVLILKLVN